MDKNFITILIHDFEQKLSFFMTGWPSMASEQNLRLAAPEGLGGPHQGNHRAAEIPLCASLRRLVQVRGRHQRLLPASAVLGHRQERPK